MNPRKNTARLAGLFWLLAGFVNGFGLVYVQSKLIVPGDAAATEANIAASESLFRAAIVSNLFSQIFLFLFGLILFPLLKEVNKALATMFLASILMTVAIAVVNQLNNLGALLVLSQADYLKQFTPEQLHAMAMIFLRLSNSGQALLEIFWTPYLVSFGLLIFRSRFLPRLLGILLMVMGAGFWINCFTKFLIPQFHPGMFTQLAMALGALGAIPTKFWLLIKGVSEQRPLPEDHSGATA